MPQALGSPQIPFWGTPTSGERVEGQGNYSLVGLGEAQGVDFKGFCVLVFEASEASFFLS